MILSHGCVLLVVSAGSPQTVRPANPPTVHGDDLLKNRLLVQVGAAPKSLLVIQADGLLQTLLVASGRTHLRVQ